MKNILLAGIILLSSTIFAAEKNAAQIIEVKVTENGFEPSEINVSSESPITLKVTRSTDATCATEILIKNNKVKKQLPLNQTVNIDLGKLKKGDTEFVCGMNMFKGAIHVK